MTLKIHELKGKNIVDEVKIIRNPREIIFSGIKSSDRTKSEVQTVLSNIEQFEKMIREA